VTGGWTSDVQSFILPYEIYKGDPSLSPTADCGPATTTTGCGHLIVGTQKVWETITGAAATVNWYANSANLTKATLGNRSHINQLAFEPLDQTRAMVGTNDGNVQYGHGLGAGAANTATWVDITGANAVLPNRPILDVAMDPTTTTTPIGYAAVGGFNANTPSTPGHVFRVVCTADCASFTWSNKTGNLPDIPVDSIIANPKFPQQVFAGTDWGLYFTNDITAASPLWYRFENGLPHAMVWDMQIDRGNTTLSVWTRSRGAYVWPLPSAPVQVPVPTAVVSRKTHPGAGSFDVDLNPPAAGIECRSGGATGDHTVLVTFGLPVVVAGNGTVKAQVTSGSGAVGSGGTADGNAITVSGNTVTIPLTNVADAQRLTITLFGVTEGTTTGDVSVPMAVLLADVNATGVLTNADVSLVKNQVAAGGSVDASNFREDVNVTGVITNADVSITKAQVAAGAQLP
jgi:hypothetical protein